METQGNQKTGALERLESLEAELGTTKERIGQFEQSFSFLAQRLMSMEQTIASVAKTMAALITELEEAKVITDKGVMSKIRKMDDEASQGRVTELVKANIIKSTETVDATSLVVVTQHILELNGNLEEISGYRIVEMPGQNTPEEVRQDFLGKKIGDKVEMPSGSTDRTVIVTVKEIYNVVEGERQGEAADGAQPDQQ